MSLDCPPAEMLAVNGPSRRRKVFAVPVMWVASFFSRGPLTQEYIRIPEPLGLPKTAVAVGAWYKEAADCFMIIVEDESFPEAAEGCEYFRMNIEWRIVRRKVSK